MFLLLKIPKVPGSKRGKNGMVVYQVYWGDGKRLGFRPSSKK